MGEIVRKVIKAILPSSLKNIISSALKRHEIGVAAQNALRPTDVFVVGHPKSGNTWVAFMLAIILNENSEKKVTMANVSEFVPNLHMTGVRVKNYDSWPSPRIFRNENPFWKDHYPKTIYLVRDPRAVVLSYYHHWLHVDQVDHGTLEEFVDEILEFGCIRRWEAWLVRWDLQVEEWVKRKKKQEVKIVRYEDLIEDRSKIFREIVDFSGLRCSPSLFTQAIEAGGFDAMQMSEKTHGAESFHGEKSEKGLFVRKGQVDSWKEEMPDHIIQKIERKFQGTMKLLGYL